MTALQQQGQAAKDAAYVLSTAGTARKNAALAAIADTLAQHQSQWLEANAQDVAAAKEAGIRPAMLDRLTLTPERIAGIVEGVRQDGDPAQRSHHRTAAGPPGGHRHHL